MATKDDSLTSHYTPGDIASVSADLRLKCPFYLCVTGPTGSGKSVLVSRLLTESDNVFRCGKLNKILYCFSNWQPLYERLVEELGNYLITFVRGFPAELFRKALVASSKDELFGEGSGNICVVLDDLQANVDYTVFEEITT